MRRDELAKLMFDEFSSGLMQYATEKISGTNEKLDPQQIKITTKNMSFVESSIIDDRLINNETVRKFLAYVSTNVNPDNGIELQKAIFIARKFGYQYMEKRLSQTSSSEAIKRTVADFKQMEICFPCQ